MKLTKWLAMYSCVLLVACGGGGGGGKSGGNSSAAGDFSLAQTNVSFTGDIGGSQPAAISINGALSNANSAVYLMVDASTPLLQNAYVEVSGTSGVLTLVPQLPSKLTVGKHSGTVTVRACKNQNCSAQYSGSPKTVTISYEVTAPDYSVSPSSINFTTTFGITPAPITVQMTSSKYVGQYGYILPNTAEPWLLIENRWEGEKGSAIFSVKKNMPIGTHTAKIILFAHAESLQRTVDVTLTVLDAAPVSSSSSSSAETSSSSSSSMPSTSSSAASSAVNGCGDKGDVFFDDVCSAWSPVTAYEQKYTDATDNYENADGNAGKAVHFNIVQSADVGRNKVLDIKYLDSPAYYGSAHILAPESDGIDMSEYAHGKIIFDLKVISNSSYDSALEFTHECTWPCASTPKMIKTDVLNEWKTYEFSVAEMIDRGLNIKRVSTGFMLMPTWAKQDGAHFQIDNVRWVKGEKPAVEETVCYANFFDSQWVNNVRGVGVSVVGVNTPFQPYEVSYLTTGVMPWVTAWPNWSQMSRNWLYWISGPMNYETGELFDPHTLSSCSGSGTLSLEIFTPAALVADGKMTFTLQLVTKDGVTFDLPGETFSVADMKPDDWNKVSVPLSSTTVHSDLKFVGMRIDATQVYPHLSAPFYVDNIMIKQ